MKTASCFGPAHILLPGENIPLEKWGCVACDQFTSDRAYWEQADAVVGHTLVNLQFAHEGATESEMHILLFFYHVYQRGTLFYNSRKHKSLSF